MLNNELPIAFPWYDSVQQQNRFRENCTYQCDIRLITPRNALLPFQFRKEKTGEAPIRWEIVHENGSVAIDISNNIDILSGRSIEGKDYVTYRGEELFFQRWDGSTEPLNIPPGTYYSQLVYPDGAQFSETFLVPEDSFDVENLTPSGYLRLLWKNSCDIRPIHYGNGFENVIYLDTFVHASDPQYVVETEQDVDGKEIPVFQRVILPQRITMQVPDFIKKALVTLPLHSYVELTEKAGVRKGEIFNIQVTAQIENPGCFSIVDLLFDQDEALVKRNCCDNMMVDPCSDEPVELAAADVDDDGNIHFAGQAPPDSRIDLYGAAAQGGSYSLLVENIPSATLNDGNLALNPIQAGGNTWFKFAAGSFNCDYGFSNEVTSVPPPVARRIAWSFQAFGQTFHQMIYSVNGGPDVVQNINFSGSGELQFQDGDVVNFRFSPVGVGGGGLRRVTGSFGIEGGAVIATSKVIMKGANEYIHPDYPPGQWAINETVTMNQNYAFSGSSLSQNSTRAIVVNSTTVNINSVVENISDLNTTPGNGSPHDIPRETGVPLHINYAPNGSDFRAIVTELPSNSEVFNQIIAPGEIITLDPTNPAIEDMFVTIEEIIPNAMQMAANLTSGLEPFNYMRIELDFDAPVAGAFTMQVMARYTNTSIPGSLYTRNFTITVPGGVTSYLWTSEGIFNTPGSNFGNIQDITLTSVNGFDKTKITKEAGQPWTLYIN